MFDAIMIGNRVAGRCYWLASSWWYVRTAWVEGGMDECRLVSCSRMLVLVEMANSGAITANYRHNPQLRNSTCAARMSPKRPREPSYPQQLTMHVTTLPPHATLPLVPRHDTHMTGMTSTRTMRSPGYGAQDSFCAHGTL
jgi:hypothetical protein